MSNLKLNRKRPPSEVPSKLEQIDENQRKLDIDDVDSSLSQYLNKSLIVNKSRVQNPNLQKLDTQSNSDSDGDMYSSLDPSIRTSKVSSAYYPSPEFSHYSFEQSGDNASNKRSHNDVSYESKKTKIDTNSIASPTLPIQEGRFSTTLPLTPIEKTQSNVSMRDKLKRLSLNDLRPKFKPNHRKINSENLGLKRFLSAIDTKKPTAVIETSPFWKYHVLKFSKDLYVTTNPSLKHMYCRNGPGYYIEITHDNNDGFTMTFKHVINQSDKSDSPVMIINKKSVRDGGHLTITLYRSSQMKNGIIRHESEPKVFNALGIPRQIPEEFIPYDRISNTRTLNKSEMKWQNYELRDFNNMKWNVGSIPRVRRSKVNQVRQSIENRQEAFKFIDQNNIYIHQNYIESSIKLPYKLASNDPRDMYLELFPPVLGMFRPCEKKITTKIKTSINKRFSQIDRRKEEVKLSSSTLNHDVSSGEFRNYFLAGDGLYYNKHPVDDMPDENTLGWITIYEDKVFNEKGMFDLVLGLMVAIGYDNSCHPRL